MTTQTYPAFTASIGGGATAAKQDIQTTALGTIHADLVSIDGKTPALGQALMAASVPVAIASNQSALPVKLQDGGGTAIVLGQAAMAGSLPVTFANNQTNLAVTPTTLTVVDQIDTTPLLALASTNIPASSSNSLSLVASLASAVKKIIIVEDIGEFFGLYSGPVATPTLLCILPLGGGEMDISIPAGTLVSIRNMKNAAVTTGFMAINFLG